VKLLVAVQGGGGSRVSGPEIRGWALARALARHHQVTVAVHRPSTTGRDGARVIANRRSVLTREARRHDALIAPVIPPFMFAALRGSSTITVADQYDPVWLELSVFTEQPGISRVLSAQRMIREAQVRFADVIAVAGERQRGLLLDELAVLGSTRPRPPRIVSVPFGVAEPPPPAANRPLRATFPQIGPNDPLVLWWGKVWKWFDADTALRAFARVVRRRPDARLVICAGKAPRAKFDLSERTGEARALSRSLGLLGQNVFFLEEWTAYDRRHEYLLDADIGLTLHRDTPEAPFAARARQMDYLWSALPCVLASGDEVAERFGAVGFARLVAPGDAAATAEALLELIEARQAREAARSAGLALAEEFRWETLVAPLMAAIESSHRDRHGARVTRPSGLAGTIGRYYTRRAVDHLAAVSRPVVR
jgi:glycosyltransferase involved in cell wall biosynthesis